MGEVVALDRLGWLVWVVGLVFPGLCVAPVAQYND
jgi:hypothetical protein